MEQSVTSDTSTINESVTQQKTVVNIFSEKYLKNKQKDKQNILKCYKYLLSKGFSYDTAKTAVERIGTNEDDLF